jgi:hypothetical protein
MLWGLQRAGNRIRGAVNKAISAAKRQGLVVGGPFYVTSSSEIKIRDRSNATSAALRKPEFLPPQEIGIAAISLVQRNFGASLNELVTSVARVFGYSATSIQLRGIIEGVVDELVASGRLVMQGDMYQCKLSNTEDIEGA